MATHAHKSDAWDSHAKSWSSAVQSITLAPCTTLISRAESIRSFDEPNTSILDDGAGGGQLTGLIKGRYPKLPVYATDISQGMLDSLNEKSKDQGWTDLQTKVQDAQKLDALSNDTFSHVFCTFVTNFTADPAQAVKEMHRVLQPGGVVGLATWSEVSWVKTWEIAVRQLKPDYTAPLLFHAETMKVDGVRKQLEDAGFEDIQIETFKCYHPETTPSEATEMFYGTIAGNPSGVRLMHGLSEDLLKQTRPHFETAYDEVYEGGKKRQYELAILAVGRKSN